MSQNASDRTSAASPPDPAPASEAVIHAVADAENVSPLELHPPLATAVDTDALDRLVANMGGYSDGGPGLVKFPFHSYTVTVTGDGQVSVVERNA